MQQLLLSILLSFFLSCFVIAQNKDQFISFPKDIHPGMTTAEVKKLDSNLVRGTIYGPDKSWVIDTLFLYSERTTFYYSSDTLKSIYWKYATKNLDEDESMELIDAALQQISFFTELYGNPTLSIVNKLPETYLREWRDIVKAAWKTPYGTITVHLRYLTRVFEDYEQTQIADGTYDKEFDLTVSYR